MVHARNGRLTCRFAAACVSPLLVTLVLVLGGGPIHASTADRLVAAYYVPYDATSWASLDAHADQLDIVAAQWVTVDACGNLGSRDDQTLKQLAQARGVRVLPSLLTLSGPLDHRVLTEDEVTQQAIDQIVAYTLAEDYVGFDLDMEAVDAGDRDAFTSFVARTASALHQQGKLLTLALPAKDRDVTVGWAGAYDYAALGTAADLITIMAYEYRGPFSGPGSVAPIDWVERVLGFATRQIPPEKVLLGLAFYGYDWNLTSGGARSLGYPEAQLLADRYAVDIGFDSTAQSASFNYTGLDRDRPTYKPAQARLANHVTTTREPPACEFSVPPPPAPTPPPVPPALTPQDHEVWVEEAASASARLALASRYNIRGVASWRLGLEDERVWPAFEAWRTPIPPASLRSLPSGSAPQ